MPCPPPWDLPDPGIEPRSPTSQADSLPSEPPGKPKNTRMGGLFLLHGIFPIQELNQGLLHGRQILYQLSYQGSPVVKNPPSNAGDLRDVGLVPGSGRSPGEGNGNPLHYSCLENPIDRGAWQTVGLQSQTWLSIIAYLRLFLTS